MVIFSRNSLNFLGLNINIIIITIAFDKKKEI